MTRDEIIKLAREAGFDLDMWQLSLGCDAHGTHEELERFAALVAAAEREACAQTARTALLGVEWVVTERVLKAIRARGTEK